MTTTTTMTMNERSSDESQGSVHLPIEDLSIHMNRSYKRNTTIFEPRTSIETTNSSSNTTPPPFSQQKQVSRAPEKTLTLFALRLAILEKAATGLGTLGFIWATVVLLGGFAITIDKIDFWLVTIILLIESTRIFSRSHELEWQHQATWSLADAGVRRSFRAISASSQLVVRVAKFVARPRTLGESNKTYESSNMVSGTTNYWESKKTPSRTWVSSDVPLLPYGSWVFVSSNISRLLYWLQLVSAAVCVFISVTRLANHNFGDTQKLETDKLNRKSALSIFYGLALAEAIVFLFEKAYWEWNMMYKKMLEKANDDLELGHTGMVSIRRFFYDAYSKSINQSIFDGLKMDMVSFAMELLSSDSSDEQLIGVRIFERFTMNSRFSEDTLQKIGITLSVIERFVEMLNWKDPQEEEIRLSAAKIVAKLVGKKQNTLRVAGIPGALESISSLLHINRNSSMSICGEVFKKEVFTDHGNYDFWAFNQLGLSILKKLARDHDNCGKIGNTRGLLTKIVDFMHADERLLKDKRVTESQVSTVKRSLQVVKMLVSSTGVTGTQLRIEISELVFTISYIRDILKYGQNHPRLQKLGIDILTSLALEDDATERIGGTGGVLKELFNVFFREETNENRNHNVRIAAGEALGMLAFESTRNCHRILKLNVLRKLSDALNSPLLRVNAARILRNLCIYSESGSFKQLKTITTSAPTVLKQIMRDDIKLQEVMIGLAAHMFKFMTSEEANSMFEKSGIHDDELAITLVQILKKHPYPPIKTPRIRRYVIELSIWMMKDKYTNIQTFKNLGMMEELEGVTETTFELESFNIFSGAIGLSRYKVSIHSLVETAMNMMVDE